MSEPNRVNQQQGLLGNVRVVIMASVALSGGPTVVDGVTLVAGDKVLLAGQTNAVENGVWKSDGAGSLARPAEDENLKSGYKENLLGSTVFVREGTLYGEKEFILASSDSTVLDGYENHILEIDLHTQVFKPNEAEKLISTTVNLGLGTTTDEDGNTVASSGGTPGFWTLDTTTSGGAWYDAAGTVTLATDIQWVDSGAAVLTFVSLAVGDTLAVIAAKIDSAFGVSGTVVTLGGSGSGWQWTLPQAAGTDSNSDGVIDIGGTVVADYEIANANTGGVFGQYSYSESFTPGTGGGPLIAGVIDGTNQAFVIDPAQVVICDLLGVFENGNFQQPASGEYAYDPATQTITFTDAPQPGDRIEVLFNFVA